MADYFSKLLAICMLLVFLHSQVLHSQFINITFIESAVAKGAVCLNGSPPAYFHAQGSGCGVDNWLIYLEGGAWCYPTYDCLDRSKNWLGDSHYRPNRTWFDGLLGQNQTYNPDFYNWNKVYLVYCDGSSFLGDVEEVDPGTNLTYRGSRVFNAIMEELLDKGMSNADNVMLAGSSAGALATILHCDSFRALVPNANRVKCVSDSGFFLHAKNLPGAKQRKDYFSELVILHGLENFLPASCKSKMDPGLCLFPEYLIEDIQTPLFILESAFDEYQLKDMLTPYIGGGKAEWNNCLNKSLTFCNSTQFDIMQEFQKTFIDTLQNLKYSPSRGMFVHTCYLHGHFLSKKQTMCSSLVNNVLKNKTIAEAIGDWYFDRSSFQEIDTTNNMPRKCVSTFDRESDDPNFESVAFKRKCIDQLINGREE